MLKMTLFDCVIGENVAVLMKDGALPSFFVPNLGDLTAQETPLLGICHSRRKKNAKSKSTQIVLKLCKNKDNDTR